MITAIALVFGAIGILSRGVDLALPPTKRAALADALRRLAAELENQGLLEFVQTPLRALLLLLDALFGNETWSWQSMIRSALVSTVLMITALGIVGATTGTPFMLQTSPFRALSENVQDTADYVERFRDRRDDVSAPSEPQEDSVADDRLMERMLSAMDAWLGFLRLMDNPAGRVLYGLVLVLWVLSVNGVFGALSLTVTRTVLRDLLSTQRLTLLFAGLLLNVALAAFLAIAAFTCILVIVSPIVSHLLFLLLPLMWLVPTLGLLLNLLVVVIAGLFDSTRWIRVVSMTAIYPSTLLLASGLLTLTMFLAPRSFHRACSFAFTKAAQYPGGFFSFVAGGCAAILTFITIVNLLLG